MPSGPGDGRDREAGADAALPAAAADALRSLGFEVAAARLVSPLGRAKGRRCAWRVEDSRGRVAKARLFEDADVAARVCVLRTGLDHAFAGVLGRDGPVVLEEWVEGRPVAAFETDATLAWAAALLAGLHARPLPPDAEKTVDVATWLDGARTDVARLATAGVLPGAEADRAARILGSIAPSRARTAIAHLDLAPDNLVVHRAAGPRVIDNEMFAVRPPGFDLARSFHLWPMDEGAWERFLRVYRASGGTDVEGLDFWRLVALALGTRIFFDRSPGRRDDAAARLVALLDRIEAAEPRAHGTRAPGER